MRLGNVALYSTFRLFATYFPLLLKQDCHFMSKKPAGNLSRTMHTTQLSQADCSCRTTNYRGILQKLISNLMQYSESANSAVSSDSTNTSRKQDFYCCLQFSPSRQHTTTFICCSLAYKPPKAAIYCSCTVKYDKIHVYCTRDKCGTHKQTCKM